MSSTIRAEEKTGALGRVLSRVTDSEEFRRLAGEIERGARVVSIGGLTAPPARALVVAALARTARRRVACVVEANRDLETMERDVRFWLQALGGADDEGAVLTIPAAESDPYAGASPHAETLERRAVALWRLAHAEPGVVLLSARALARRTVTPDEVRDAGAILRRDADFAPEELIERLAASGYVREDPVRSIGSFSSRGGILDVWSPLRPAPVRIEFFGDTVDSIREFDPETQLSTAHLRETEIVPMREIACGKDDFRLWAEAARERFAEGRFARSLEDRTAHAETGEPFGGWEFMIGLVKGSESNIFEHLGSDTALVVDEPAGVERALRNMQETLARRYAEVTANDEVGLAPEQLYLRADELRARLDEMQRVELRALGRAAAVLDERFGGEAEAVTPIGARVVTNAADDGAGEASSAQIVGAAQSAPLFLFPAVESAPEVELRSLPTRRYHGRIADLARDALHQVEREARQVLFVLPSTGTAERVREMLDDYAVTASVVAPDDGGASAADLQPVLITTGRLTGGFELSGLVIHTEENLFDETTDDLFERRARGSQPTRTDAGDGKPRRAKSKSAAFVSDFRDLKIGDYVVHVDHGIAKFQGLQTLDLGGRRGEFMLLTYAEDAKLFVPVERLDLVQRYSSAEAQEPTLDKLGGLGWQKTKAKAKRAMRDMADDLLKLYAERKMVGGYAFSADSPWQREFEEGFPYQLTPDQATSIEDAKRDMEAPTPMDRLLCGDVGYGKTEVAMRAAFKAVMDGKQVAVLTPTTVLAYQHFETFRSRFAAFPVTTELLSRFRTAKEQKEAVKRIETGEVDVVIGTHRILSKDVRFRDLGLVIVDEEQRFGVTHKERLKQLKKKVDVLTLSATPIPRTLNMSLLGLRDMSVIETPPRDRLAINTQVVQFGESVIKSAIELELNRGGQAFFIHNRVETIDTIAALVKRIVPEARVCVAHGQMNEQEMERVVLDFVAHKYDVLVSTTIIENGIDIPRANTIIINRADNYGLSQLYQLRGRVGRSNRRAYAYLLIPAEATLTPIARRRLAAIREFSELGAGFRIAALDLELRGAGNLLGGQQSGHMDALGFDLYTQMLERTVAEMKGEITEDEAATSLNLGVDVAIPEEYISDMGQRLRTYKRIASARDDETLEAIRRETEDRYGRLPESVVRLFGYASLRRLAETMSIVSIDRTPTGVAIKLGERARVAPDRLLAFISDRKGASFTPNGVMRLEVNQDDAGRLVEIVREVLLAIRAED